MGTIAARDCTRVLDLTDQVLAAGMMCTWQGVQLRLRSGQLREMDLQQSIRDSLGQTAEVFPFLDQDRALESDLERLTSSIRRRYWVLYE